MQSIPVKNEQQHAVLALHRVRYSLENVLHK